MKISLFENQDRKSTAFRYILLAGAIVSFLMIAMGSVTRLTGGSAVCPDWPACGADFALPQAIDAQIQYVHRALAVLTSLLIGAGAFLAWTGRRQAALIRHSLLGATALMVIQVALGAQQALSRAASPWIGGMHTALALGSLGFLLVAVVAAFWSPSQITNRLRLVYRSPFARMALWTLGLVFIVIVSGIVQSRLGMDNSCSGWPLCSGGLPLTPTGWLELGHRLLTGIAGIAMLGLYRMAWRSQRSQRLILAAVSSAAVLFVGQALVGALKASRGYPLDLVGLHAVTTAALWSAMAVAVAGIGLAARTAEEERAEAAQPVDRRQRGKDFLALTKPIIVVLLLVTTYAGMVVGGQSIPSLGLTLWTLIGGAFAAGGSGAINQYIDRELDKNMQRTAKRPLAAQRMTAAEGLAFGLILLVAAFYIYAGFVNLLAALLSLAGMIYYILVYSIFLKKATVQNIVIGGGAGAIPPLVGWAAATGNLAIPSLFLFAIVFLWTPPHFWALALVRQKDYARAGVPMLPVVRGEKVTRTQIFIYTLELVGLTLLMPVFRMAGSVFLISSLVLGGLLIYTAWRVISKGGNKTAWHMYRYSSMYLALIFVALMVDALV